MPNAVDPRIALSFDQYYDPIRTQVYQGNALNLQRAQQEAQAQNALKALYANPANVDASGNPTPNALRQIMAIDPDAGMKIEQNIATIDRTRQEAQDAHLKRQQELVSLFAPTRDAALNAYQTALKQGLPQDQAIAAGQRVLDAELPDMLNGGGLSDEEKARAPKKFDPQLFALRQAADPAWQKEQLAQRKEDIAEKNETEKERHDQAVEDRLASNSGSGHFTPYQEAPTTGPDGKPVPGRLLSFDSKSGKYFDAAGNEVKPTGGVEKVGGGSSAQYGAPTEVNVTGDDGKEKQVLAQQRKSDGQWVTADENHNPLKVKAIAGKEVPSADDPSVQDTAKMIANYQMAPLTAFALRSPWGQAVMAEVHKQNPNYDATQYAGKNASVVAFDKGKQGDTTRSLNVVVQHLDLVGELGKALNNGDNQTVNKIKNRVAEEFGDADVTNFDVAKGIVGDEIVKATIGYAGGMADRENAQNQLARAKSWPQLLGVIKTAQGLAGGQLMGLRKQYEAGTGLKNFDDKYLMPETVTALEKAKGAKYASADDVKSAYKDGKITKDDAAKILRDQFGFE